MPISFYTFLHASAILLLTGGTFYAFAAPEAARKRMLMLTGIASLLALVGGFGLIAKVYDNHFYLWIIVKIVCWLGLTGLTGMAFRRRAKLALWVSLAVLFLLVAVAMVCFKPGM
jgi:hypothetical protein